PSNVSHFKCYEILDSKHYDLTVKLKDQFVPGLSSNILLAHLFCVPIMKKTAPGAQFPIVNPDDHLVIYLIDRNLYAKTKLRKSQFGTCRADKFWSDSLAVPTTKTKWEEVKQ